MTVNEKMIRKFRKTYLESIKAKNTQFSKGKLEGLINDILLMEEIMREVLVSHGMKYKKLKIKRVMISIEHKFHPVL